MDIWYFFRIYFLMVMTLQKGGGGDSLGTVGTEVLTEYEET